MEYAEDMLIKNLINTVVYLYFWVAFCELAFTSIRRQLRTTSVENRIHGLSYFRGEGEPAFEAKSLSGIRLLLPKMMSSRYGNKRRVLHFLEMVRYLWFEIKFKCVWINDQLSGRSSRFELFLNQKMFFNQK